MPVTAFVVALDNLAVGICRSDSARCSGIWWCSHSRQRSSDWLSASVWGRLGTGAAALAGAVFVGDGVVLVLQTASAEAMP